MSDMWLPQEQDPREQLDEAPRGERNVVLTYLKRYRMTMELKCQGLDAEQLATEHPGPGSREEQPDACADRDNPRHLPNHESQHVPSLCAQRHSQSDFARSSSCVVGDDAVEADAGEEKTDRP